MSKFGTYAYTSIVQKVIQLDYGQESKFQLLMPDSTGLVAKSPEIVNLHTELNILITARFLLFLVI